VQGEPPVFERDQFVAPHSLEDAVRVHRGQTEHVGQIRLRKGQPDHVIQRHADRPLPPDELAQDIGHTPARGAPSERDNALPQHGVLLHRAPPQGGADPRMVGDDFDYRLSADCGDPRRADRGDGVVGGLEQEPVQVEEVAGYQDGQDLPPSLGHQTETARHPPSENKRRARRFTLDHDVGTSAEAFFRRTQRLEHADISIG
jgi:hypothetical protein